MNALQSWLTIVLLIVLIGLILYIARILKERRATKAVETVLNNHRNDVSLNKIVTYVFMSNGANYTLRIGQSLYSPLDRTHYRIEALLANRVGYRNTRTQAYSEKSVEAFVKDFHLNPDGLDYTPRHSSG